MLEIKYRSWKIIPAFIPKTLRLLKKSITNFIILSIKHGQYASIYKSESLASKNSPVPWYTYPAIEFLKQIDFKDKLIFEFGSGNSTTFWASRCTKLISVDHDKEWFEKVKRTLPNNAEYYLIEENYQEFINTYDEKFDVIIIDGINRFECAVQSLKMLSDDGFIILDNSDWFEETSKFLRENDLIEIDFSGFGPINDYTWTTSFYLRRKVNLIPAGKRQPNYGVGSLKYNEAMCTKLKD